jgi:integrase
MVSIEEMYRLIKNCISVTDKALFLLLYDSGCVFGEILTLRIKDLQNYQRGLSTSCFRKNWWENSWNYG